MKEARASREEKWHGEKRDSFGKRKSQGKGRDGNGKGERMGRDGKLTRSLLPGALGAENKDRENESERKRAERSRESSMIDLRGPQSAPLPAIRDDLFIQRLTNPSA